MGDSTGELGVVAGGSGEAAPTGLSVPTATDAVRSFCIIASGWIHCHELGWFRTRELVVGESV